jgi:hypothetical protein
MAMADFTRNIGRSQSDFLGDYHFAYKESVYLGIVAFGVTFSDLAIDEDTPLRRDPTLKGMEDTSRNMEVWLETTKEGVKLKAVPTR